MHIENPYALTDGVWLRANLHAHTTRSDGRRTPQALVDIYRELGYDVLMISDHDQVTPLEDLQGHGLILIGGNEITANGVHICHIGAATAIAPEPERQRAIDQINAAGGLAIINHPNWESSFDHCPYALLQTWQGYHGVEIYNGVCERHPGDPLATNKWDRLLGDGRRAWAYANDDTHRPDVDEGRAWNMIWARVRSLEAVMEALRTGSSYCSTGVMLDQIAVEGKVFTIRGDKVQRIAAVANYGRRVMTVDTGRMKLTLPDDFTGTYIRFECWGQGDARAWTQPFYVER
ncbi:MAG: CehA/McbA family metallohydrolase [Candidatus Hydrogenedentes bacterium]|nr:CehA/McbA family metallohydrolase [Candidatus Hydrogenedentota bacterium]